MSVFLILIFRVTVVKKYGDIMHVSYCDFGDIATLDSSQLKTLPLKFRQLPKMAIQAKLYGKFLFSIILVVSVLIKIKIQQKKITYKNLKTKKALKLLMVNGP